jgi:hypothetical protein
MLGEPTYAYLNNAETCLVYNLTARPKDPGISLSEQGESIIRQRGKIF